METRSSRKRAEASSSQEPPRSSKRSRSSPSLPPPSNPPLTRSRRTNPSSIPSSSAMDNNNSNNNNNNNNSSSNNNNSGLGVESSGGRRRGSGSSSGNRGKEQEPADPLPPPSASAAARAREREAERLLGLNFDSVSGGAGGGSADEDDSEGGASMLHQNFTTASSALQGLLRKLGAGLDDLLPSSALSAAAASSSQQGSRLKKILSGLRSDGEEGKQVESLTQLCEMLSIGTEDSLGSFSVDSFVPVLVSLLNHESNADVMLLAARALTHLCDVLPSSCAAVVHYGAVPCFCARLLTIEYMDLAEQSLQALKKISQEHPTACLRAGALMAVLSYLDFFSTGVQRVALSTAANMCRKLPSDASDFVMEAVPLLTNLLNYHDSKVLEHASVCLTRIAESFASSPDKLDELCNHGLVAQAASLVSISNSGGQSSLSTSTYTGVIRLLSTCASGSPLAAKTLMLLGISGTLKDIISGSGLVAGATVSPALSRPPEQIYEIVNLADELLPPLPQGTISLPMNYNTLVKGGSSSRKSKQEESSGEVAAREKLLEDQPELLMQFGMDLLPVLTQVYGSSINGPIRHKCLSVIGKLMYYSSADMIQTLIGTTNISSFLAGILAWKDPQVLIPALQIAEILMEKLPETFSKMFVREGVVHAIDSLIQPDPSNSSPNPDSDPSNQTGSSSRSRRYRRRTSGGTELEESKTPNPVTGANESVTPGSNSSLRVAVSGSAKAFKDKYFPSDNDSTDVGVTDDLRLLRTLCAKLNNCADVAKAKGKGKLKLTAVGSFDVSAGMEEQLDSVISDMLAELSKGDGVSTFEFIGSGTVMALLNYLSCGTFNKEKIPEGSFPKLRQQAIRRFKSFISVALPFNKEGNEAPMATLVQKLQNALSSLERFPVVLSHSGRSSTTGGSRLSSGLGALSQPFKLRLCRAQGEKSLRDYSSNVVLIDPLASLAAVEDFLWPRIQRTESIQKSFESGSGPPAVGSGSGSAPSGSAPSARRGVSTRSTRSSAKGKEVEEKSVNASSSKGKGKAVAKSEESKGVQTRSRKKAGGSEKDSETKQTNDNSSSEDDDLDASPVELDDTLMIDEDDISEDEDDDQDDLLGEGSLPICAPERVLDVKLPDGTEDSSSTNPSASSASDSRLAGASSARPSDPDLRAMTSVFGSRGAMSFAAAAMAGLASVSGRGSRGGVRDRRAPAGDVGSKLAFSAGGRVLSKSLTIYQAIQRQMVMDEEDEERFNGSDLVSDGSRFLSDIFTITYQKADGISSSNLAQGGPVLSGGKAKSKSGSDNRSGQVSLLDSILQAELPCDLEKSNPTYNILALLRVLEGLNQLAPRLRVQAVSDDFAQGRISSLEDLYRTGSKVPIEEFVNSKLTPKLARQIQDVLALCSGSLPSWCYQMTKSCPFLFPFETRRQYFYSTAFGLSRALHRLQQQQGIDNNSNEREVRVGRLQRQKVRVSRNRILDSASKVMEMFSSQKAVLEVEYFGEVGTGLGPTLEFYTLLSHDLQRSSLNLWRSSGPESSHMEMDKKQQGLGFGTREDLVRAPLGLFPRPWPGNADVAEGSRFGKVVEHFRLMGRVMAKALQDGRLLDLPLSTAFYKLILGQELDLYDILSFDSEFGKILQELQVLVNRKSYLESENNRQAVSGLRFRGAPIEDLCLDFTLPGYPDYVLKRGHENTTVSIDNLEEYINLVVDATVKSGIVRQIEAFKAGFNQVFDVSSLEIFSPHELDYLICGRRELWEADTLVDNIKFDHGFTAKSPPIVNLLEIMAEFTPEEQHSFCQFVTGAPRLPPGGLAALNPKLTIVRKHPSSGVSTSNGNGNAESADEDLPSVMTCANYLKLPPYSTKEVMYKKLMYAIKEGQGSFDLS